MDSCPKELEPFEAAHKAKILEQDELQYMWWKNYGISALMFAVDHCLNGKKARTEFLEEPILSKTFKESKNTYEKELDMALIAEKQWIASARKNGLPETVI